MYIYIYIYIYISDIPILPVFQVNYRVFSSSTGLPGGRTFLHVFAILGDNFFFLILYVKSVTLSEKSRLSVSLDIYIYI